MIALAIAVIPLLAVALALSLMHIWRGHAPLDRDHQH